MREGMQRIRDEFGDDAIIVSTEQTEQGVLIRVATERPEPDAPEPDGPELNRPEPDRAEAPVEPPPAEDTSSAPAAPTSEEGETDLPPSLTVRQCLDFHGLPRTLASDIAAIASRAGEASEIAALGAALDQALGFSPLAPATIRHPLLLVGDAGAGKTVTLAKLATQARLLGREVTAITADTGRAGGTEQLAAFTRAIGVDLWPVERPEELSRAVGMAKPGALVLIDSPAVNPLDCDAFALRRELTGSIEPVLVMASGTNPGDAGDAAGELRRTLGVRRVIATRLDTGRRYGAVLAAARIGRISLAGISASRRIAEPVEPAEPNALARRLFNQMASRRGA